MRAQRIVPPSTAFSVAKTKQKRPRIEDAEHLKFIRGLKCCICGAPDPDPAHIRSANAIYGKRETGGAEKASDKWVTPLCRAHHDEQHNYCEERKGAASTSELLWWASKGIDPFGLALALHSATGDDEIAEAILNANRRPA